MDFNLLKRNAFTFNLLRIPETTFRVTSANIPSVSVSPVDSPYPPGRQYFPGSAPDFGELNLSFLVDEDLNNYEELYRWIIQQRFASFGNEFIPESDKEEKMVSDGFLTTLTNASNPNRVFYFKDLFPINLGELNFETSDATVNEISCQVSFKFSYFELKPK